MRRASPERHGQLQDGLGWAPGCGAGAPRDPHAARDSSQVTRGSAEGAREGAAQHDPPRAITGGHRGLSGGAAWTGSAVAVRSRTGRFRQSHRGFGTPGGGQGRGQCQDREVKRSGSIPVPSSSLGLSLLPPHALTPVLTLRPGWGCQRLFLLLSHTSASIVSSLGSPSRDHRSRSAPVHTQVCPRQVGTSACGAPGAAPTPRISQCGLWSHWATKLPVFLPKTAPPRLPRPLLPLLPVLFL